MSEASTLQALLPDEWLGFLKGCLQVSDEERAFRQHYVERMLGMARIAIIFALALTATLCVMDWILMPSRFAADSIPFRVSSMLLPLAFALATGYVASARNLYPFIVAIVAVLVGTATIAIGGIAARSGVQLELSGAILATFYAYLVLGLRVQIGAIVGWSIFLTYFALGLIMRTPLQEFAYGSLFLALSNVGGMYASYLLEQNARKIFQQMAELRRLARTDGLTGICNRRTFDEHLTNVWRQARRDNCAIAAVLVDIDFFKLYNDCYGHQEGDKCIRAVANILATSVNRPLDLVARYGGGDFAIVMYDPAKEFLDDFGKEACKRIYDLEIPHKGSDCAAITTVSIGAALVFPREGSSSEQIIRSAEDALYEAKDRGRNQSIVYQTEWSEATSVKLPAIAL